MEEATEQAVEAAAILGFDPSDPAFRADPYPHYRALAAGGRLQRTEIGLWVTTSHELCERISRDPRFGHQPKNGGLWRDIAARHRSFLTLDPPDHTRLRGLVSKAFTPRLVERLRPRIEALVDELLDAAVKEAAAGRTALNEAAFRETTPTGHAFGTATPGRAKNRETTPGGAASVASTSRGWAASGEAALGGTAYSSGTSGADARSRAETGEAALGGTASSGAVSGVGTGSEVAFGGAAHGGHACGGAAAGEIDLISALAYPLPVIVISEMLGVPPGDHALFKGWSACCARGLDPDFLLPSEEIRRRDDAREEFGAYFRELAARRRAEPRDDLLSALVRVSDGGDVLSEDELIATCVLLLIAGHETTVNLIGNGALALLRSPEQLAAFRARPGEVPTAVEEILRYDPPVQLTMRAALDDVELDGSLIERGRLVMLLTGAANRDPSVFRDPDRLDLSRYTGRSPGRGLPGRDAPHPLSFGHGIHFCLGATLARMEAQIALRKLFERDVALTGAPLAYRENLVLRGLRALPVTL
ncbi:cytochrome P450 [Actinomadura terrae]|uniref:cytochrome P450 n=1 Tax=Actinomadura terrae TaxID=604353 RepID=UPI001FA71F4E|nr:cytochrome P450 [Actinomadura terrae]